MIADPSAPGPRSPAEVGGKAASLFRLSDLGFDVPEFFVLTAEAYRAHPDGRVSGPARDALLAAWRRLGGEAHAWAVRSSGVAEDSLEDSFAGVFDTVLDVRGADALVAAVERCWASHRSAEAAAYRDTRRVADDSAMAVVVQRMVDAAWAGVAFTADPLTQALSVTVVNATRGLGEALVSGTVAPEEIRVRTANGEVLARRTPDGMDPLPDHLVRQVVDVSNRVAERLDFPQDLEWAVEAGRLRLLQSRPITTVAAVFHNRALEPWRGDGDPDAAERLWGRAYADEIWTPPVSPLFYDVQNLTGLVTGLLTNNADNDPAPPDVFKYFRAAAYIDLDVLERVYAALPPTGRRPGILALLPPERRDRLARAPRRWSRALSRAWRFEVVHGARWGVDRNHAFLEAAWPGFLARTDPLMARDPAALTDVELDAHLAEVWEAAGSIGVECQVAVVYHAQEIKLYLSGLLDRWFGDGDRHYAEVSSGLDDSRTVREAQAIWEIAAAIRAAGVAKRLRRLDWANARALLVREGQGGIGDALERFRFAHRHRGANYKDLIHPRWGDDPDLLWGQVKGQLDATGDSPAQANAASAERRRTAQAALLGLSGLSAPVRGRRLRRLFRLNELYASLRDNHRYYYDRIWWLVRRVYLDKGRRAFEAGRLAAPGDVFFLGRPEIEALAEGGLDPALAAERIAVRRGEWEETLRTLPPRYLANGYAPIDDVTPAVGDALEGLGASPGEAVGRARIVRDIAELGRIAPGEVLVTRQTDPSWTPAFARLGGLVLETGGVLAHGASLCREFGLPCVTGVEGATNRLRDGELVRVSGSLGRVERIEPAATA